MTNPWKNAKVGDVWLDGKIERRVTGVVAEGFDTDNKDNWREWTAATRIENEGQPDEKVVEFRQPTPYVNGVAKWTRKE